MKNVVVYYSLTQFNEKVAKEVSRHFRCKSIKITEKKQRGKGLLLYLIGGFEAFTKKETEIDEIECDFENYENVILVSPIWAGHIPPAVRTFLKKFKDKIKNLVVISVSGMGDRNKNFKNDFKEFLNGLPPHMLFLTEKEVKDESYKDLLKGFYEKISKTQ